MHQTRYEIREGEMVWPTGPVVPTNAAYDTLAQAVCENCVNHDTITPPLELTHKFSSLSISVYTAIHVLKDVKFYLNPYSITQNFQLNDYLMQ